MGGGRAKMLAFSNAIQLNCISKCCVFFFFAFDTSSELARVRALTLPTNGLMATTTVANNFHNLQSPGQFEIIFKLCRST